MFCPSCGRPAADGAKFCPACGVSLPELAPSPVAPSYAASTPVSATEGQQFYAGFWRRAAAAMIDGFVIGGLSVAAGGVVAVFAAIAGSAYVPESFIAGYYVAAVLCYWLYFAVLESSARQATLGKRAVGVFVAEVGGRRVSFGRATGRTFGKAINSLTLGIGWLLVGFTRQKRGLHDYVAGTVVLRRSDAKANRALIALTVVLVLVIPVAGIVAAIGVPGLLRARMSGNEASAIGSVRTLSSAEAAFAASCGGGGYAPDLAALATAPRGSGVAFIPTDLSTGTKAGYQFNVTHADSDLVAAAVETCNGVSPSFAEFFAVAAPVTPGTTGARYFAVDQSGVIRQSTSPITPESFGHALPLQ